MATQKKQPQDHKPAAQAEAEGDTTATVEHNGKTLTFSTDPDEWPVEALLAFEEGKVASAIRGVLGPTQWRTVMASKPTVGELKSMFSEVAKAMGFTSAGE